MLLTDDSLQHLLKNVVRDRERDVSLGTINVLHETLNFADAHYVHSGDPEESFPLAVK